MEIILCNWSVCQIGVNSFGKCGSEENKNRQNEYSVSTQVFSEKGYLCIYLFYKLDLDNAALLVLL